MERSKHRYQLEITALTDQHQKATHHQHYQKYNIRVPNELFKTAHHTAPPDISDATAAAKILLKYCAGMRRDRVPAAGCATTRDATTTQDTTPTAMRCVQRL